MSTSVTIPLPTDIERVLIGGDLAQLKPEQRLMYYNHLCESLGLNPLTKPFQYLNLSGKTVLYATKDCTEQLRRIHTVSVKIIAREVTEGCYVVTAQAAMPSGRVDESIGAVPIEGIKGEARANAFMKCETKAKRRVTLSICGLGMLDESEVDSIPGARVEHFDTPQQVAERKIRENNQSRVERGLHAIEAPKTEAPMSTPEQRHTALVMEANAVLDEPANQKVERIKGDISFKALKNFRELKDELRKVSGTDQIYYEALTAAGVGHADELSTVHARNVYKHMSVLLRTLKQDKALKEELEGHLLRIGAPVFMAVLGSNGFSEIDEVMANATGAQVDGLLRELKEKQ